MNADAAYLKPNIQIEPLIDQWYAWSHLIPPATAARNITERHLKIIDSYISAPSVHANAAKNPKLLGGPFIDYERERVEEIKELRERTATARSEMLELSRALGQTDELLRRKAKGFSLRPLYSEVPECLRGFIELVYDLNNHPAFRILEPLMYRSKFYSERAQTFMLSETGGDDRPFVLSTPRLPDDRSVHVQVPFSSSAIDDLVRMKYHAKPIDDIAARLGIAENERETFAALFTSDPAKPYVPYTGPSARWRYFGHACILIETRSAALLFDPVLSYTYETGVSRYTYDDLPAVIDFVIITHNHQDHVLFETLLQIRHKTRCIVVPRNCSGALQDPSLKLILEAIGFRNVVELDSLESIPFEEGYIQALPFFGEHADLDIRTKLAYLLRIGPHSLMFAADSCNIEPMVYEHIHNTVGNVDVLFLGMECDGAPLSWLYGPLLTTRMDRSMDASRRLAGSNCEEGMAIVERFGCSEVYVYAMGQEPWLNHVMSIKYTPESRPITESNELIARCSGKGIVAERLFGEKEILLR